MKGFGKKVTLLSAMMCIMAAGAVQAEDTSTSYATNFGDVDGNLEKDVFDMEAIQKDILGLNKILEVYQNNADVNRNGIIDILDMEAVQKDVLGIEAIENLTVTKTNGTVSVHDPSVVKDEKTGTYYIFGSHMAWAKSTDLCNWTTFTNNINTDYKTLFAKEAEWSARGTKAGSTYDVSGNLWAPDVIWNEEMGKWCMYMSVNGDNWYTSIVLLTADSLGGNWTYVGPVVYSGFTSAGEAALTDYSKAAGTFDDAAKTRYLQNRNGNRTYSMNAIDPCVLYDDDGNLWMTYGSWFGGIYMLKLDGKTGLRDYTYTYATIDNESDIYQGLKIAGGQHCSGEASYIQKVGEYYYLFMSYGGLTANGGYNMRVFRSDKITGPYKDYSGDDARYTAGTNNICGTVGVRLMTQYKWNTMDVAQVAQGHNSAFVDSDGKAYVIYHTRTNDGTEGHYVKTHQLFMNEEGWLVAAPYCYSGETLNENGYSAAKIAGTYDVIINEQNVDYANLKYISPVEVTLNGDGTVSGKYTGTWSLTEGTPYVTINMNNQTYKGVAVRQIIEGTDEDTMCLTLLGTDEKEVWFSKQLQGKRATVMAVDKLTVASTAMDDLTLPTEGIFGTKISWTSSNPDVIATDGTVTKPKEETTVTLTATFENNGYTQTKSYDVTVYAAPENNTDPYVIARYYTNEKIDLTNAKEGTYAIPNPFNSENTSGLEIYNGAAIEFDVELTGTMDRLDNIVSFTDSGNGKLYFTGGSYLGYNALGGYYDANMADWALQKDYIGKGAHIRIDFLPTGYKVSVNGETAYTNEDVDAGTTKGGNKIDGYNNVLKWLNSSATTLNLGWGNWWPNLQYDGTISNIVCYAYPTETIDTSKYVYYEGYNKTEISAWSSASAASALSIKNDGDSHGNYVNFAADTTISGNRGAYSAIDCAVSENYTIETDIKITPGNIANRSASQFVITTTGTDATAKNNNGVTAGYLVKLAASANSNVYTINDNSKATVTIASDTWVTVKAVVTTGNTVALTITDQNGTVLYSGNVTANGSTELDGLYMLRGRGVGAAAVDTIKVSENK